MIVVANVVVVVVVVADWRSNPGSRRRESTQRQSRTRRRGHPQGGKSCQIPRPKSHRGKLHYYIINEFN